MLTAVSGSFTVTGVALGALGGSPECRGASTPAMRTPAPLTSATVFDHRTGATRYVLWQQMKGAPKFDDLLAIVVDGHEGDIPAIIVGFGDDGARCRVFDERSGTPSFCASAVPEFHRPPRGLPVAANRARTRRGSRAADRNPPRKLPLGAFPECGGGCRPKSSP